MDRGSTPLSDLAAYLAPVAVGRHGTATDVVTAALREAILDGVLAPGTWLREQDIAAALGVSRTPVRGALRLLDDELLVSRTANRGAVVRAMGFDEILAVYVVRASLEGLAARTAALRRPDGLVLRLEQVRDEMRAAADGPPQRLASLNLEFHRIIRESTANPYLDRFLLQVEHAVRRFGSTTYDDPSRAGESLEEHDAIIRAIEAGDAAGAEHAATTHMSRARDARIASLVQGIDDRAVQR